MTSTWLRERPNPIQQRQIPELREFISSASPPYGGCGRRRGCLSIDPERQIDETAHVPACIWTAGPAAALARVDAEVGAQCKDARDFNGCVRVFTSPAQLSNDIDPLAGVMGQGAVGLISGPTYLIAPTSFS